VVEGYFDVIAMVTAGYPATVAPLGTALSETQLKLLWRLAAVPTVAFDGDDAGRRASDHAIDLALTHLTPGKSLRFALLSDGRDPDDLLRSEGAGTIDELITAARPLADVLWTRELEAADVGTPDGRAGLEGRLTKLVLTIKDATVRRHYEEHMRARVAKLARLPADGVIEVAELGDSLGLAIVCGEAADPIAVHRATGLGTWHVSSMLLPALVADAVPHYVDAITVFAGRHDRLASELARLLIARGFEVYRA
jgi:Toprim-like/DnaB-helicase binding domain of primase